MCFHEGKHQSLLFFNGLAEVTKIEHLFLHLRAYGT